MPLNYSNKKATGKEAIKDPEKTHEKTHDPRKAQSSEIQNRKFSKQVCHQLKGKEEEEL